MSEPRKGRKESDREASAIHDGSDLSSDPDDNHDADADELTNRFETALSIVNNGGQYEHETDGEIAEDEMVNAIYTGRRRPRTYRTFFCFLLFAEAQRGGGRVRYTGVLKD